MLVTWLDSSSQFKISTSQANLDRTRRKMPERKNQLISEMPLRVLMGISSFINLAGQMKLTASVTLDYALPEFAYRGIPDEIDPTINFAHQLVKASI